MIILANRLAYFIVHGFKVYPNNAYLFKNFKSYKFEQITDKEKYKNLKQIFKRFKNCSELSCEELARIQEELKGVKKQLKAEKLNGQKKEEEKAEDKKEQPNQNQQPAQKEQLNADPFIKEDPPIIPVPSPQKKIEEDIPPHKDSVQADKDKEEDKNDDLNPGNPFKDEGEHFGEQNKGLEEEKKANINDFLKQLLDLENIPNENHQKSPEEPLTIPLPPEIEAIVSQPFPINDGESLTAFFQRIRDEFEGQRKQQRISCQQMEKEVEMEMKREIKRYRENLSILLQFENKLKIEIKQAADPRFEEYLRKADQAFQISWQEAINKSGENHNRFQKLLIDPPVEVCNNGEVICTSQQLDYVLHHLNHNNPKLFLLAFNASTFGISQEMQMARLVQLVLGGEAAQDKKLDSPYFIRLRETEGKATLKDKNPPLFNGPFVYAHFIGPNALEPRQLRNRLHQLANTHVHDWLCNSGITLKLPGQVVIKNGQVEGEPKSAWVGHVRDIYTNYLAGLSKEDLNDLITDSFNCPLVCSALSAFEEEVDGKVWESSEFPAEIMEKIFEDEFIKAGDKPQLYQELRKTIEDAYFANEETIEQLAQKAGCPRNRIEPLIRMRVMYLMCCLQQQEIGAAVRGIERRTQAFYDPAVGEEQALSSHTNEQRVLEFDETFDQLQITLLSTFTDSYIERAIAQAQTLFSISSITKPPEAVTKITINDIQELRLGVFTSKNQRHYLAAQIVPQILIDDLKQLAKNVEGMEIVEKTNKYHTDKSDHDKKQWTLWRYLFDTEPYRDLKGDNSDLRHALYFARILATYASTAEILLKNDQLSDEQWADLQILKETIQKQYNSISDMLKEIYPPGSYEGREGAYYLNLVQEIKKCLELRPEDLKDSDSEESSGSVSDRDASSSYENDDIIGKMAGLEPKGVLAAAWDNTLGYATKQSNEPKCIKWKIKRYEDLLQNIQTNIVAYLTSAGLSINQLLKEAGQPGAEEWLRQVQPILKLCSKQLRDDKQRINSEYLKEIRQAYTTEFLSELRKASVWAKDHPNMPGAQHVNAMCYQLYTTLDLNRRCLKVLQGFIALGKEALKDKPLVSKHPLPEEPLYDLIRNLERIHQQIKAVPNDAKAPLLHQWANSLRGHLNGVWGVAAFDPNLQSNPVHVILETIIEVAGDGDFKGYTQKIKDIAMGSPTIETGNGQVEINPEFLGKLRHCAAQKRVHFYSNNQDFIPKSWVHGNESGRCQALHDLADKEFKGTLYVVTFSKNSPFYRQKGHQIDSLQAKIVKDSLIFQLLDQSNVMGRFCLPI